MSDQVRGARRVMYWVLGASVLISLMLIVPRMTMEISSARVSQASQDGKA